MDEITGDERSEKMKLVDKNEILKLKIENKQLQDTLNMLNTKVIRR